MEFYFPIYPFIWNYNDMYCQLNYDSSILENYNDDINLLELKKNLIDYEIIQVNQKILRENLKNISIHTWYLKDTKLFEIKENFIKIISNSSIRFKTNVPCLIFDPNYIFERMDYHKDNITIIRNINLIKKESIPELYIHTHNIDGIFRLSPNKNSRIQIKKDIVNATFYIILNNIIIKFNLIID